VLAKLTLGLNTNAKDAAAITIGVVSFENLLIIFLTSFLHAFSVIRVTPAIGRPSKLSQPERVINSSCGRRAIQVAAASPNHGDSGPGKNNRLS
jgi:hypothetical protein